MPVISVRTNRITNPGMEVNTAGWSSTQLPAPTRVTTEHHSGVASLQVVTPGAAANEGAGFVVTFDFTIGASIGAWVKAPAGVGLYLQARFGSAVNDSLYNFTGTGDWQLVTVSHPPFPDMTSGQLLIRTSSAIATTFYIDDAIIETGLNGGTPFTGDTPAVGNATYAWTGTANASTSTETLVNAYQNPDAQKTWFFGTTQKMQVLRLPSTGMQRTRKGYSSSQQLENGGLNIYEPSRNKHLEYKVDFGVYEATGSGGLDTYADYAQGFYGDGNIYFSDPMYYDVNVFSYMWSAPGMVPRPYTLSGVGGIVATAANSFNQPVNTMVTAVLPSTANNTYDSTYYAPTIIPIPPGYTLWLGWSGSVTDGGLMRMEYWTSGAASQSAAATLAPVAVNGSTRMNASVPSTSAEYVKIGYSRSGGTNPSLSVTSMTAQLWPTGMIPVTTGSFQSGQGNNGCRFLDDAVEETYVLRDNQMRNVHYKGLSFSLAEVGSWQ